jgi:predicted AAA+ superfamily ATPase
LLINEAIKYQRGLIITDDVAVEPILDFELYRNAIVNIIKNSYPKFTIGIFGEWGAGKTTLMKSIEKEFEKIKKILYVYSLMHRNTKMKKNLKMIILVNKARNLYSGL